MREVLGKGGGGEIELLGEERVGGRTAGRQKGQEKFGGDSEFVNGVGERWGIRVIIVHGRKRRL